MIEIGLVIAIVMSIGAWLKAQHWFPNGWIPFTIVVMSVLLNLINTLLFGGDMLEAGKMAFIEALAAIGIHSGLKNSFEKREAHPYDILK